MRRQPPDACHPTSQCSQDVMSQRACERLRTGVTHLVTMSMLCPLSRMKPTKRFQPMASWPFSAAFSSTRLAATRDTGAQSAFQPSKEGSRLSPHRTHEGRVYPMNHLQGHQGSKKAPNIPTTVSSSPHKSRTRMGGVCGPRTRRRSPCCPRCRPPARARSCPRRCRPPASPPGTCRSPASSCPPCHTTIAKSPKTGEMKIQPKKPTRRDWRHR